MTTFHADDYIHFLQHVTPDNMHEYRDELSRCNFFFSSVFLSVSLFFVSIFLYSAPLCSFFSFKSMSMSTARSLMACSDSASSILVVQLVSFLNFP
jgi:hypothetical protein